MELTKEHFEHVVQTLATKKDLEGFATKDDLAEQTKELKAHATEQTEELARIIANTVAGPMEQRFATLESRIDVAERVLHLEADMHKIKEALHI